MIKIILDSSNCEFVEWEKGNKRYKCFRNVDGDFLMYSLYIMDFTSPKLFRSPIISDNLADINKRLEKAKFEIVED